MPFIDSLNAIKQLTKAQIDNLSADNRSDLYHLEARYTLFHLNRLLQNSRNHGFEIGLKRCLAERWLRIKGTDLSYFYDFENPANICCVALAKVLAPENHPWIFLLAPSLERARVDPYISSSIEDLDIELRHICLDDSQRRVLFIPDILAYAESSACLYHSSLFTSEKKLLSPSEKKTILLKHRSVSDYFHAIEEKVAFDNKQETLGYRLQKLIKGLKSGSTTDIKSDATEFEAGSDADWAIIELKAYLETLSIEKKTLLFQASLITDHGVLSIQDCWNRLIRQEHYQQYDALIEFNTDIPDEDRELSSDYCVGMIYQDMETIINIPRNTQSLFQAYSYEQLDNEEYNQLQQRIVASREIMLASLASAPHFDAPPNQIGQNNLACELFTRLAIDLDFILTPRDKKLAETWRAAVDQRLQPNFSWCLNQIIKRGVKKKPSFFEPFGRRKIANVTSSPETTKSQPRVVP